jgi:putative glutathione S-transferase
MTAQFATEETEAGESQRQEDAFRDWISNDGSSPYPAAADRYHLYVSLACPWARKEKVLRIFFGPMPAPEV